MAADKTNSEFEYGVILNGSQTRLPPRHRLPPFEYGVILNGSQTSADRKAAQTVFEYGGNIWSGMMVYYCVPSSGSFRYGLTYLAAIIGKPLQILGITNEVWNFADFSVFLTQGNHGALINTLTQAMGGSFSGEVYFNFGWFSIVLIPIFGYYLAKFSHSCFSKQNNPVLSGYLLYVATLVIWWVRQYFTSVSWQALFYGVFIFVLYSVLSRRSAHRKGTSQ